MSRLILLFVTMLILCPGHAQDFTELLPKSPPKNAAENTRYLLAGLTLQAVGIGLSTASVYFMIEAYEEGIDIGLTGFGMGLGMAAAGTALVAASVKNIGLEKRAWREYRQNKRKNKVSFNFEPTSYGLGIVCRF